MRIIAGKFKGTQLSPLIGKDTRPTTDRVRQTLFDILLHAAWGGRSLLEGAILLDAFAGTGALGIEALSRGAEHACFFEKNRITRQVLEKNIQRCRLENQIHIGTDVLAAAPARSACTLIFLDPPYGQELIPVTLERLKGKGWIASEAILVTETASEEKLELARNYTLLAERKIGTTCLKFWQNNEIPT